MHPTISRLPVNWIDGMKINKTHFNQLTEFAFDAIRDATAIGLNDLNFGLLEPLSKGESCTVFVDSERIEVRDCRAVTRGGMRIELSGGGQNGLITSSKPLQQDSFFTSTSEWFVVLKVNPFARQAVGEPNAQESPLRQPFTEPSFSVELVRTEDATSADFAAFALPLAKIKYERAGITRDEHYIAPCAKLKCSEDLLSWHKTFEGQLREIEKFVWDIIRKIHDKRRHKSTTPLAEDVFVLCEKMVSHIAATSDDYRLIYPDLPPVHTVSYFCKLARVIGGSMKLAQNKAYLVEYLRNYVKDIQAGTFEERVDEMCNLTYNHLDISLSLQQINAFLQQLLALFSRLAQLDYEQLAKDDAITSVRSLQNQPPPQQRSFPQQPYSPPQQPSYPPPQQPRSDIKIGQKDGKSGKKDWFE
jgi:hypothetical protein